MVTGENLDQPATKGDVYTIVKGEIQELRKELPQIVTDAMKPLITEEFRKIRQDNKEWRNEILTGNDKVAKDYQTFETENAAIKGNYETMTRRVDALEDFAAQAAPKLGLAFKHP